MAAKIELKKMSPIAERIKKFTKKKAGFHKAVLRLKKKKTSSKGRGDQSPLVPPPPIPTPTPLRHGLFELSRRGNQLNFSVPPVAYIQHSAAAVQTA